MRLRQIPTHASGPPAPVSPDGHIAGDWTRTPTPVTNAAVGPFSSSQATRWRNDEVGLNIRPPRCLYAGRDTREQLGGEQDGHAAGLPRVARAARARRRWGSVVSRTQPLDAEGFELIARGFALLAQAARERASSQVIAAGAAPDWIPAARSPLGRRRTLQLARSGALESAKVGRAVLVHRASLARFLDEHRRATDVARADGEDLFGARGAA